MVAREIPQLYDSEKVALHKIKDSLLAKHSFKGVDSIDRETTIKRQFTEECVHRCAEAGFGVDVEWEWDDPKTGECSPNAGEYADDWNIYWNPRIVVHERFDKGFQFDHERQQTEVASGILDGKKGYIREDGSWHEDPLKKIIVP